MWNMGTFLASGSKCKEAEKGLQHDPENSYTAGKAA